MKKSSNEVFQKSAEKTVKKHKNTSTFQKEWSSDLNHKFLCKIIQIKSDKNIIQLFFDKFVR